MEKLFTTSFKYLKKELKQVLKPFNCFPEHITIQSQSCKFQFNLLTKVVICVLKLKTLLLFFELMIFTSADIPLGSGTILTLGSTAQNVISFDVKFVSNGSISVVLDTAGKTKQYTIHYVTTKYVLYFITSIFAIRY